MHREHRSKYANNRREITPPPEPGPYDSDSSEHSSGEHTDSARAYEGIYFSIPTRRMYRYFLTLKQRAYENTRMVDMDTLRELAVEREFLRLTGRIGFSLNFWSIEANSYGKHTQEFLSSLQLKRDEDDRPYIKFRLCSRTHRVRVNTLREWFGFHLEPQTAELSFHADLKKEKFWTLLTSMRAPTNKDYKACQIPHPVLRIIQRALASTIFARGETVSSANNEDLILMDHMLRLDSELQCPDLMIIMIHHLIGLQRQKREGGNITCCAYVTYIGERLGLQFTDDICTGPTSMDTEALRLALSIRTQRGTAWHRDRHWWRMPDGTERLLPFEAPISITDDRTWRLDPRVAQ